MKSQTKERLYAALTNASEMIRGHTETGVDPDEVGEEDEKGLAEYTKACIKAASIIEKIAQKYKKL